MIRQTGGFAPGANFHEIEIKATGHSQRFGNRFNSELVTCGSDKSDFA